MDIRKELIKNGCRYAYDFRNMKGEVISKEYCKETMTDKQIKTSIKRVAKLHKTDLNQISVNCRVLDIEKLTKASVKA